MVVCSVPFFILGKHVFGPSWWVARFNLTLFLLFLAFCWYAFRAHFRRETIVAFILIMLIGSMFPYNISNFFGEVFTATLVASGVLLLRRRPVWGGGAVALAVANTPAALVGVALGVGSYIFCTKRLRYTLIVLLSIFLVALDWWAKSGEPAKMYLGADEHGYKTLLPYSGLPGFSYPFSFGVLSILFSFGKGIFFFSPGLLLCLRSKFFTSLGELRNEVVFWLCFLIGLVLVYAKWWSWYGGWFWGPRFFLFSSIVASLALALAITEENKGVWTGIVSLSVLALSIWVGISGAAFGQRGLEICAQNQYANECFSWYVPEFSALWRPFVVGMRFAWKECIIMAFGCLVFMRLAMPTVLQLARQARTFVRSHWEGTFLHGWRW